MKKQCILFALALIGVLLLMLGPATVSASSPSAPTAGTALKFGTGTTTPYVTFGNPAKLHLATFTVECWFRRDGTGATTSTGTGGLLNAIPLVTRGRGEAETTSQDLNYFLGIDSLTNTIAADFEEGAGGAHQSLNHPVLGVTPIVNGTWYHAAATYDGNKWQLFLNGTLERELVVGQPPAAAGDQHAAIASALQTTGAAAGHFDGTVDEARIWNRALPVSELRTNINSQLTSGTGLVARYGMEEGTGTVVGDSIAPVVNGTLMGSGATWPAGAPFDIVFPLPSDPTGLTATASVGNQIFLAWTDTSSTESRFEIERSTTGSGGPFTFLAQVGQNIQAYSDSNLANNTPYCYRVRAANDNGNSGYTGPQCATTPSNPNNAIHFGSSSAYVTFGDPAALKLATFTIETWFMRKGPGVPVTTGSGGIPNAIPLVTKGTSEVDNHDNKDMNYFLGINYDTNVLVADMEEGATGASPSLNHPILGTTAIALDTWYHAAATYDGNKWQLFLNGNLENELVVGQPVRQDSIQHAALATSIRSTGVAQGFFDGILDEVRIWNYARSGTAINTLKNYQIPNPSAGLVARWGLSEGTGTSVQSTAGTAMDGILTGTGASWTGGYPFSTPTAVGLTSFRASANEIQALGIMALACLAGLGVIARRVRR